MMDERSLTILRTLVHCYIEQGSPVGSRLLVSKSPLQLSAASVRHIMADLEEAGYLYSPHISAGRIPTTQGYRMFVDHCLMASSFTESQLQAMQDELPADCSVSRVAKFGSQLLAKMTHLAGVVTLPKPVKLILKHIEFLPLSSRRILVILVLNNGAVENRVMTVARDFSRSELEQMGNELTDCYAGQDLLCVRQALLSDLQHRRSDLRQMLDAVVDFTEQISDAMLEDDFALDGEAHLFEAVPEEQYQSLREVFAAFSRKRDVLHVLNHAIEAEGVKIFIGEESGYQIFDDYSVVAAPYQINGEVVGVLGVIGPCRMPYDQVIKAVDVTAKLLSSVLQHPENEV